MVQRQRSQRNPSFRVLSASASVQNLQSTHNIRPADTAVCNLQFHVHLAKRPRNVRVRHENRVFAHRGPGFEAHFGLRAVGSEAELYQTDREPEGDVSVDIGE